jgi:hypothetical protein
MARKNNLTEKQWLEIERRYIKGESARSLGAEFKIPESTIRNRYSAHSAQIKKSVKQIIEAEETIIQLPISAQISAQSLLDDLRAISKHLAGAAKFGAMTAHRLSGVANQHAQMIDDAKPDENSLMLIARLQATANESAKTGLNLLAANKEQVQQASQQEAIRPAKTLAELYDDL